MKFSKKLKKETVGKEQLISASKYHFENLAPIDNADISIYEEAIDFAFDNPDIRNVAISGAYGAGKSSVLATYERKYADKKFIHISLAHFEPEKEKKAGDDGNHPNESVLEGKILNQLIHQLNEKNIPQTNFRIKNSLSWGQVAINSVLIIAFLTTVIHLTFSDTWINFVSTFQVDSILKNILELTTTPISFFISGCIGFGVGAYYIYSVVKKQRFKAVIRKLSLQGNDIELFENNNDSFFDKYLNEVLYLFENTHVDAVVFEDMDRYEMEGIFERLREVSTLANIRLSNKKRSILRFFFLLRDDLFVSKDRTKFFDYIIPVIPVVDSSNSYDQLIGHMRKNNLQEAFKGSFLQGLSLYIDDMRLLKNICNEFLIYSKRLGATELDSNKMLAIITYKNIFPRDFSELQINQGFIYALFANKNNFILSEQETLQEQIDQIEVEIAKIKGEHLKSLRELDAVYVDKKFKNYNVSGYGDTQLSNWIQQQLNGTDLKEYNSRRKLLEIKLSGEVADIERRKSELLSKKQNLKRRKLCEIISRDNIDTIFSVVSKNALGESSDFNDVKRNQYFDLLKYLIRNGYIDESYADYMTYFYPNSLTTVDKVFLQSVTNKVAKGYDYELKNPALVLQKLNVFDFKEEETLNFSLLTYMLQEEAEEYVCQLIKQLRETGNVEFVSQYLDITLECQRFVVHINTIWPEFFTFVLMEQLLPARQIWKFAHYTLYFSSEEDVIKVNATKDLGEFISLQPDFLDVDIDQRSIACLLKGIQILEVKFESIDYTHANHELFIQVYKQDAYVLNYENIDLMLRIIYCESNDHAIRHQNYSLIISKKDTALYKYIQNEIAEYANIVLEFCDNRIEDNEEAVIDFLNHAGISTQQKQQYINKLCTKITDLTDIQDNTLWGGIISAEVLHYSEENIMVYWDKFGVVDDSLAYYINGFEVQINMRTAIQSYDDSAKSNLFEQIVKSKGIINDKYTQILTSMNRHYAKNFGITGIPDDKMLILIESGIISMTTEALKSIRANYPKVRYQFIKKNFAKYVEIMTAQLAVHEELIEILSWKVADDAKFALLRLAKTPISVVDKGYSTSINLYILQNRLEPNDLQSLYTTYPKLEKEIQLFVIANGISKIESIINGKIKVAEQLKIDLLGSDKVVEGNKFKLLLSMLPSISKDCCKVCFDRMGLREFLKIFETHSKPKIAKTAQNEQILKALQGRKWVYDYPDYPYDDNYYTVRRNAPGKKKVFSTV